MRAPTMPPSAARTPNVYIGSVGRSRWRSQRAEAMPPIRIPTAIVIPCHASVIGPR